MITTVRTSRGSRVCPDAYQLRISLDEIKAPIWRRLVVKPAMTFHELHRAIQVVFEWYDYHLYRFEVGDRSFEAPDPEAEAENSKRVKLSDLRLEPGTSFKYLYDFGDGWQHTVKVEDPTYDVDVDWLPTVVAGERAAPPEDCGGPYGYLEYLELLAQPTDEDSLEPDDLERISWIGRDFDPELFSVRQAAHALLLSSAWGCLKHK